MVDHTSVACYYAARPFLPSIPVQIFHSDRIHMTAISHSIKEPALLPTALPHVSKICATGRLEFTNILTSSTTNTSSKSASASRSSKFGF